MGEFNGATNFFLITSNSYGPKKIELFAATVPACASNSRIVNRAPIIRGWFFKYCVMSVMVHSEYSTMK